MSPEQFEETGTLSPASDVYSFGIVLYEMVVGRRPFSAVSINEWYTRHAFAQPSSPAAVCGAPAALSAIVLKCLEKRPEDRFHDFIALGNALEHYCRATRRSGLQPSRPSVQELEAGMPPVLWYRRGHALTELGRHDDAYECYRRSLVTDPAPFGANAAFAAALQRQGRLAEALPFYEREAAQHPGGLSFCQLAGAYRDAGRPVDALSASRKSVVADGSVIDGATLTTWREHAKLVRELGAAGEYQRAIERIKELLSHAPFDNARSVIGTVVQFAQLDDWDAATAFHVLSIERFPDDPLSWYNFGVSLHRAGDDARAFDAYSRALNLEPHLPWALFARGLLLALHANYAAARADWKLALEALPEHRVSQLIRIVDKKAWAAPQILAVARSLQARLTEGNWFLPYDGFE
jgi:tetratricopeptide (TPR) repeat protein